MNSLHPVIPEEPKPFNPPDWWDNEDELEFAY